MADDAAFPGPKGKGPNWLLIGGAGIGIVGLFILISKSSSGSGTTAAGTSINAALASVQEEQQNLLGTVQSGALANSANFMSISGQIADTQAQILAAITAQGTATAGQIQGAIDQVNQNTNAGNQGIMSSIADALGKILSGQTGITSTVQSESQAVQTAIAQGNSNIVGTQQQIIGKLGDIQTTETQMMNAITPMLSQIYGLIQQVQTQQGQDAVNTQAKITDLGNQIIGTIQQFGGYNEQNFITINNGLASVLQNLTAWQNIPGHH